MAAEMKRVTLLTVAKMLNATKDSKGNNIATKVPIVAIGTKELTEKFLAACESVLPENEELLPDQVCDVYNALVGDREITEEQKEQTQTAEQADATLPVEKKEKKEAAEKEPVAVKPPWKEGSTAAAVFSLVAKAGTKGITLEQGVSRFEAMVKANEYKSSNPASRVRTIFTIAVKRNLVQKTKEGSYVLVLSD